MKEYFILYGTKDKDTFYISNTNPVIWTSDMVESKLYHLRYTAEFEVLRDYNNYRSIISLIDNKKLDCLYLANIALDGDSGEYIEKGRVKLL